MKVKLSTQDKKSSKCGKRLEGDLNLLNGLVVQYNAGAQFSWRWGDLIVI